MAEHDEPLSLIEPDLLIATCQADGSILTRNDAWTHVLGDGESLWKRLEHSDQELAARNVAEAASGSLVTHALFMATSLHRDIPIPILLHFVPVHIPGDKDIRAVAITGEVLTEPSTWTESQTHRHRMETLGRMTMGMAHDFNNLLSGILGHIELWRLEQPPTPASENHLKTIEQAATDGADLIGRIQRYIRQEARSSFEPVDLVALVEDCVTFTRPYWYNEPRRQGIHIEVEHISEEIPLIDGSRAELRDVFVNLILNSVHAMPKGGRIQLRTRYADNEIVIDVQDNGEGMPEVVRNRVFEPLFSTKGEQGNGMGLAVAAGTMREHFGSISVASVDGEGTTFTLRFPVSTNDPIQPIAPLDQEVLQATTKGRTMLVVDDEDMVRNVICRLLGVRGHSATGVS